MAKAANATMPARSGPVSRLREFFEEVKVEMSKVTWPSWAELKSSTSVVLVVLFLLAGLIGAYDVFFLFVVSLLLKLG